MNSYRKIFALLLVSFVACATTNSEIVSKSTKQLLKGYRGQKSLKIAIMPMKNEANIETSEMKALSEVAAMEVFNDGRLKLVERSLLDSVFKEWTFGQQGFVDPEKRAQFGKLTGANLVLVPTTTGTNMGMRIISVDTGEVLAMTTSTLNSPLGGGGGGVIAPPRGGGATHRRGGSSQADTSSSSVHRFGELLIQLETSVNFSAQSSGWRDRRSGWLSEARSASSLDDAKRLLIEFEAELLASGQNQSWISNSRSQWVSKCRNASSLSELGALMRECESNILYSSQSSSWSSTRSGWMSSVQALE